jgi:aminomethyltransferase
MNMKKTKLYDLHKELGAKIVDFAGFEMPVYYSSIINEHKTVRNNAGVFDVSHMGEVFVRGPKALDFVQHITTNDASKLFDGKVQYSAMCYEDGGIVDDLLVYRISAEEYLLVINASNIEKDFEWMRSNNKFGAELQNLSDEYSLLAVQGPRSLEIIEKFLDKKVDLQYYAYSFEKVFGEDMILSRTGYTGELGFELYFKGDENLAADIWKSLFECGKESGIEPVGLGARDSLRLEMGYCLYGNDISKDTNPLEAGLGWITKLKKGDFIGSDAVRSIKENGVKRKLVGMISDEKAFPRPGYEIRKEGRGIGKITSGTVSPILNKPVALGYVDVDFSHEGSDVNFFIRNKEIPARIVKLPFVNK